MVSTADFWQLGVDDDKVFGGPARILVSDKSVTTYPEVMSDVISMTTYLPASNWYDLGHTNGPFEITDGFEAIDWESQQVGVFNSQIGNWNRRVRLTLMQLATNTAMEVAHDAYGRTTNADGDEVEYFWNRSNITAWRLVAIHLDESRTDGANMVMDVFPNVKRSGADVTTTWDRANPQMADIEFTPFPDEDVPNDAPWYRISQVA